MENINFNNVGIANLIVTKTLINSYINENFGDDERKYLIEFYNIIKDSPILELELKVINNIENKNINDNTLAMRYIDDNIKLFEIYSLDELNDARKKLGDFVQQISNDDIFIEDNKVKLYENIKILIDESLKYGDDVNVDAIHESFEFLLNYLNTNKEKNNSTSIIDDLNEDVINIAINKFNDKYSKLLKEEDLKFFKKIVNSNLKEKKDLFEYYKNENLTILNSINSDLNNDKVLESINKINNMEFNQETINNNLIKLYELNKNIT